MAGRRTLLFGVVLIAVHVGSVMSSTLYQWVVDSQTRFNYDPDRSNSLGVYNWPRSYPESCSGQHQSPVDIDTTRVKYGVDCQCPRMVYSSPMLAGELKNNGLSAAFEPEDHMAFSIQDAPQRPGTYYLNDFHLHFGGVTGRSFELQGMRFRGSGMMSAGSEHTIDGLRFEGELHFVFYNSKYQHLEEAESKPDGVVVIVLMVQKLPGTMADTGETSEFSRFLENNIPRIYPYLQNASLELDLRIFFNRMCEFYTYTGSITTPTCHESARWVILKEPIMVTERAWFSLTGLQSRGDFNSRFGNYRTTQPLNDRVIEANFNRTEGAIRPMPNGDPIMGPMMFMGPAQQPDVPMPTAENRSPMLNNPNRMQMQSPAGMMTMPGGMLPPADMSRSQTPISVGMLTPADMRRSQMSLPGGMLSQASMDRSQMIMPGGMQTPAIMSRNQVSMSGGMQSQASMIGGPMQMPGGMPPPASMGREQMPVPAGMQSPASMKGRQMPMPGGMQFPASMGVGQMPMPGGMQSPASMGVGQMPRPGSMQPQAGMGRNQMSMPGGMQPPASMVEGRMPMPGGMQSPASLGVGQMPRPGGMKPQAGMSRNQMSMPGGMQPQASMGGGMIPMPGGMESPASMGGGQMPMSGGMQPQASMGRNQMSMPGGMQPPPSIGRSQIPMPGGMESPASMRVGQMPITGGMPSPNGMMLMPARMPPAAMERRLMPLSADMKLMSTGMQAPASIGGSQPPLQQQADVMPMLGEMQSPGGMMPLRVGMQPTGGMMPKPATTQPPVSMSRILLPMAGAMSSPSGGIRFQILMPTASRGQMSMPVFDRNVLQNNNNNNNNNNDDENSNNNSMMSATNRGPAFSTRQMAPMIASQMQSSGRSTMKPNQNPPQTNAATNMKQQASMMKNIQISGQTQMNTRPMMMMINMSNLHRAYYRHMQTKMRKMWQQYITSM